RVDSAAKETLATRARLAPNRTESIPFFISRSPLSLQRCFRYRTDSRIARKPQGGAGRTARFRLVPILETLQSQQSDGPGMENAKSMNCVDCGFVIQAGFA